MRLTSRHVRATYDCFRNLPPFDRWRLPEHVEFRVTSSRQVYGTYQLVRGKHRITISRHNVKCFQALTITVAHEMLHLRQELTGTCNERSQHNRDFVRLAKRVCKVLGFSDSGFV